MLDSLNVPYVRWWTGYAIFAFREVQVPQEQIERKFHFAASLGHLPEAGGG